MLPIKPLSVKFDPDVRERLKKAAFLLDWPEGQFVNASVHFVLDLIDHPSKSPPRFLYLVRQALEFEKNSP